MDLIASEYLKSAGADSEVRWGVSPDAPKEVAPEKAGPSVTPGLLFSGPITWEFLAANVDTLDLSLYVDWGPDWPRLFEELTQRKLAAMETGGVMFRDTESLMLSTGGKRFYTWHLQRPDVHLFLKTCPEPQSTSPNVSASLSARALWEQGPHAAPHLATDWVRQLGGTVTKIVINRLDLAADFAVSDGLTYEFLKQHCICRSRERRLYENDDVTETAYFGSASSPIQLRIYNKTRELAKTPTKTWLYEVWGRETVDTVFRVEFQIRREALRQYAINDLPDLKLVGGIWEHLTIAWFSLRIPDNANSTRRGVHPFWEAVSAVSKNLGTLIEVHRTRFSTLPDLQRNQAQILGHLVSFAGLMGLDGPLDEVASQFVQHAQSHDLDKTFQEDVQIRRIKFGVKLKSDGSDSSSPRFREEE